MPTSGPGGIPTRCEQVLRTLTLDQIAPDCFVAGPSKEVMGRIYGGQVVAQALVAAQNTVAADRLAHSCHAYFVRAGDPTVPITFTVSRDRDGRSFSARRVVAVQRDKVILTLSASMHIAESGGEHQFAMPDVPPPEQLENLNDALVPIGAHLPERHQRFWLSEMAFDFRAVEDFETLAPSVRPATRHFWMRAKCPVGDDMAVHRAMLAYASDLNILHTGLLPLATSWADARLQDASLDHALWFHRPCRVDDWLLYALDSPVAAGARAYARGTIFDRGGALVASVSQEGLIRVRNEAV